MSQVINGLSVVRVLVADSNPELGNMLAGSNDDRVQVVGACRTGADALRDVREQRPDVLLASWNLPDMDGLTLLRQLRKRQDTRVVLVVHDAENRDLTDAVSLGAAGALDPGVTGDNLLKCVCSVAKGEYWFRRDLTRALLESLPEDGPELRRVRVEGATRLLTPRETDVMLAVARGKTNRDIALELKMSEHTVKQHLKQVFGKLRVSSRVELVLRVAKSGV